MVDKDKKNLEVYEHNAQSFGEQRDKSLFEKKWLDRFLSFLEGNEILDIGCGSGDPIAKYLIEKNLNVTGVDYSQGMIDQCYKRFPGHEWLRVDMRNLNLDKQFDGIIAWNSFFHLNHEDQMKVLNVFEKHLKPHGVLMFTAGPERGEIPGFVNDNQVYHWSLSLEEYQKGLSKSGFKLEEFVLNDSECQFHSVFLSKKV